MLSSVGQSLSAAAAHKVRLPTNSNPIRVHLRPSAFPRSSIHVEPNSAQSPSTHPTALKVQNSTPLSPLPASIHQPLFPPFLIPNHSTLDKSHHTSSTTARPKQIPTVTKLARFAPWIDFR